MHISFKMINNIINCKTYYLCPSSIIVEKEISLITTVLGSCVSVCLYDPKTNIGGINHYMLPLWNGRELPSPKYGNIAISKLIEKMEIAGCHRKNLIAKIFGGSNIFYNDNFENNIGEKNVQLAIYLLNEFSIPVKAKNTGGFVGRKIVFNTFTGEVYHKFLNESNYIIL